MDAPATYRRGTPLLLAKLSTLVLDYVARPKVQCTHLNGYILEQLPIVPLERITRTPPTEPAATPDIRYSQSSQCIGGQRCAQCNTRRMRTMLPSIS